MTLKSPRFHPDARVEYVEALVYHEAQREGYGAKFEDEVFSVIERVRAFPNSGAVVEGYPEGVVVRAFTLRRFRYSLMVVVEGDQPVIYAVAHQHRRPGYWRERLS